MKVGVVTAEENKDRDATLALQDPKGGLVPIVPIAQKGRDKVDKVVDPGKKTGAVARVARGTGRGMIVVRHVTSATADPSRLPSLVWRDGSSN
jgi:hypothetical protein